MLISDHYVPATDEDTRRIGEITRSSRPRTRSPASMTAKASACGAAGARPPAARMFVVGGDSHSPTGGAFGAYMFGVGARNGGRARDRRDLARGARDDRDRMVGRLAAGVVAKDIMLVSVRASSAWRAADAGGPFPRRSSFARSAAQERMTLANMTRSLAADWPGSILTRRRLNLHSCGRRRAWRHRKLAVRRRRQARRAASLRCQCPGAAGRGSTQPGQCGRRHGSPVGAD